MAFRNLLTSLVALTFAGTLATPADARMLDPDIPEDALEISKRLQCGGVDGESAVYHWAGNVYARTPGVPDRLLFKGEGMNVRRCVAVNDPVRGPGYRMVSREVMFYLDPETGEVLDRWENPWTGEALDVMHIHNDPVNSRPSHARTASGEPFALPTLRESGPYVFVPYEVPLFYTNPLAGDYQEYVGNAYHAMEIFDFAAMREDLYDTDRPTAHPMIAWVRLSDWMPWMKMGGRPGQMVFNAMGRKLSGGFEELPDLVKNEIRRNYPEYVDAPPADDTRPNETTWTKFKKLTDERRMVEGGAVQPHE